MIRDYGPVEYIDWTSIEREGTYEFEVSARNLENDEVSTTTVLVPFTSRLNVAEPSAPVASETGNPMVFLFSAPGCATGGRMRVDFQGEGVPQLSTPLESCKGVNTSMNFYLAGLHPGTSYSAHAIWDNGSEFKTGPEVSFMAKDAPAITYSRVVEKTPPNRVTNEVLLDSNGLATDLAGKPLWALFAQASNITRAETGGYFWGPAQTAERTKETNSIRKFDLVGMTVLETNAERVNQQLRALGKREIGAFHHEVRTLPDGRIAALASVEQILNNVQGQATVDVIGDMIVVFDKNLNVVWTWDTFDHLDVNRAAIGGGVCSNSNGGGGCPPFYLAASANDWTHGNSIQQTPDGNLLFSARHQDWLIKINYNNGEGDGSVLWRLGKDGDFRYEGSDPWPWFSHQHDGNFLPGTSNRLLVFDNGNTRVEENDGTGNSRGQLIQLDEANRTATLVLNADLGVYSQAVGAAQRLRNGRYHFDAGYVIQPDNSLAAYSIEVDSTGQIVYQLKTSTLVYRSFRMTDIYTPN